MIKKLLMLSAFLFMASSANAIDEDGNMFVLGIGTRSCGSYVTDYKKNYQNRIDSYYSWIAGYFTFVNSRYPIGHNIADGADFRAITQWTYNYCEKNPLENLFFAADALLHELADRKGVSIP